MEDLSAYLDAELSDESKQVLEKHLQTCHECQQILVDMQTAWQILDHYTVPTNLSKTDDFIRKFYTKTLPASLIQPTLHKSFPFVYYVQSVVAGIAAGLCLYLGIFYDQPPYEFEQHLPIWEHPDFELISTLDLLENYELLEYFSLERLQQWKKQH